MVTFTNCYSATVLPARGEIWMRNVLDQNTTDAPECGTDEFILNRAREIGAL